MIRTLLAILLLPFAVLAQSDDKADAILKKVSAINSGYKDIHVDFSYTLQNTEAGVNDTRSGQLSLAGNQFHLQLMGQDIYSDGKIVWYVMKDDQEVHVKSIEEFKAETELDPSNFFSQYDKGFKSKFNGEESKNGKSLNVIDLFPEIPGKKSFSRIRMGIDKATNHIVYSKTFGKDGTDYLLEVKSMKTNTGMATDSFTFSQSKFESDGYDVVDFR
jgi:outer membrane lipoprotein-sorting protein